MIRGPSGPRVRVKTSSSNKRMFLPERGDSPPQSLVPTNLAPETAVVETKPPKGGILPVLLEMRDCGGEKGNCH